jgi:predicted nucleotide-binding protein (sugar kinase/HSP70/actin superfamily)
MKYIHPYFAAWGFGGYGLYTIAHASRAKSYGYDGIIHVHSFSCMPEIIAKSFIKRISQIEGIPAMTIVVEEISSKELFHNRLEAFIDIIRAQKENRSSRRDMSL